MKVAYYDTLILVKEDIPTILGMKVAIQKKVGTTIFGLPHGLPRNRNEIAAVISIALNSSYVESHYKKFEENKNKIEKAFSFENINPRGKIGNVFQLSVVKRDVDLTQTADWDTEFRWLRENLEKLYWVLRVHDTLGWDTASSTENFSEDTPF